jgi:malate dehydrogenase (oxaloacetate-decarboxylating)
MAQSAISEARVKRSWRIGSDGGYETTASGVDVLKMPLLNKGTAFPIEEREALGLTGLLPTAVTTLEDQIARAYAQYQRKTSDLAKNVFLNALRDRNEVTFFRLFSDHFAEMLPIVYTPTIADAIEQYNSEYRRPRGVYLSIDRPEYIEEAFRNFAAGPDEIDLLVATDGESILGIGDWGIGGINICVGKLAVYTAGGGIHPGRTIPVMLDVGTDRRELLDDPLYIGYRHPRVRGDRYDDFIDKYVKAATRFFPNAILHWEDLGPSNAHRILQQYREHICTFNDDMQGTGGVVLAAVLSAARASGIPLREQRIVIFGAGTAGIATADQLRDAMIGDGLSRAEATRRVWCVDRAGLLTDEKATGLLEFQVPYARPAGEVRDWQHDGPERGIGLTEVVRRVHPTILIGTSTARGAFTEEIVREMVAGTQRPIIFPLSNPSSLSEALPADLIAWTDGRALVATGSPFAPVTYHGVTYVFAQANNALLFPGLGLGVTVSRAQTLTDGMFTTAARTLAGMVDVAQRGAALLPHVRDLRSASAAVAIAVARAAAAEGVSRVVLRDVEGQVREAMWQPDYVPVRRCPSSRVRR